MQSIRQYREIGVHVREAVQAGKTETTLGSGHLERPASDSPVARAERDPAAKDEELLNDEPTYVEWDGPDDTLNPRNWPQAKRAWVFAIIFINCFAVDWPGPCNIPVGPKIAKQFHVSQEAETLSPALYTFGIAVGALAAGPLSETVGRNPIYVFSRIWNVVWLLGSALAPNFAAQCVFRFLAGTGGSILLAIHAASIADMYNPIERTLAWPTVAMASFIGTIAPPIAGGWIAQSSHISWRWTDRIALIISGATFFLTLFLLPETFGPILLKWKATHLRKATGNSRFIAQLERQPTFISRLKNNVIRALHMFTKEPIVACLGLWLVILYVVIFGLIEGASFIYGETYGWKHGLVGCSFAAIGVGTLLWWTSAPVYWYLYRRKVMSLSGQHGHPPHEKHIPGVDLPEPEYRLWTALPVALALPISLFWLGWTNYSSISPWSGLGAEVLFGMSWAGIYVTVYQYILDVYGIYAGSALAIITFFRYGASGAVNLFARPMYGGIGVHWSMTLLGCIALLLAPAPLFFYWKGPAIRASSRFAGQYSKQVYERRNSGRAVNWN